jgi:hypothetical protein
VFPEWGAGVRSNLFLSDNRPVSLGPLAATSFGLKLFDLFRGFCFCQGTVKFLTSLAAKSLEIRNLRACHWFLAGDPLVGRFFGIRIGICTHAFNFAAGVRVGRTPGTGGAPNPPSRRRPSSSIEDGGGLNGRRQWAGSSFLPITRKNDRGRRTTTTTRRIGGRR